MIIAILVWSNAHSLEICWFFLRPLLWSMIFSSHTTDPSKVKFPIIIWYFFAGDLVYYEDGAIGFFPFNSPGFHLKPDAIKELSFFNPSVKQDACYLLQIEVHDAQVLPPVLRGSDTSLLVFAVVLYPNTTAMQTFTNKVGSLSLHHYVTCVCTHPPTFIAFEVYLFGYHFTFSLRPRLLQKQPNKIIFARSFQKMHSEVRNSVAFEYQTYYLSMTSLPFLKNVTLKKSGAYRLFSFCFLSYDGYIWII